MNKTTTVTDLWQEIESHLQKKRREINEEIQNYPPPIPACDVQFNHLLDERTRIAAELNRLRHICGEDGSLEAAYAFMDACPYIDESFRVR